MTPDHNQAPLNPLPWVVWAIALPLIAMELFFGLGSAGVIGGPEAIGWRLDAVQRFAYSPDLMRGMLAYNTYPPMDVLRLVTYPLVHQSLSHALFAIVILLALGKMVGEVFRPWAMLVVVIGSGIFAALVYTAVPGMTSALIGAYPPVYGLIGAFTFLLWVRLAGTDTNPLRAFTMIAFLLGAQLVFGMFFGGGTEWVADFAGFAAGFLLSFVVSPGGWGRVMARIRQR